MRVGERERNLLRLVRRVHILILSRCRSMGRLSVVWILVACGGCAMRRVLLRLGQTVGEDGISAVVIARRLGSVCAIEAICWR